MDPPSVPKADSPPRSGTVSPTKSSLLCALIMAGGSGERFWPLSTPQRPKQLLSLFSDKSMIRETVDRILPLIEAEKIFVATNILQVEEIKKELPDIPHTNIIVEPAFKDTAAAIGYSSLIIDERFKDLKISHQRIEVVVLASDHLIQKSEDFRRALSMAADEAKRSEVIVLLGIKPNKPETGYGYIEVADNIPLNTIAKVRRFREKPNLETAEHYLASGKHYWNSGMFIFSIDTIFNNFRVLMEDHHETFKELRKVVETGATGEALSKLAAPYFNNFEKISIDYGIMELSTNKRVILVDIGWSDIGSFAALTEVFPEDTHKNVVLPGTEILSQDSSECIVIAPGSLVSLLGVEHLIIAKNGDNILIAHKDRGQDIKKIVMLYNQRLNK